MLNKDYLRFIPAVTTEEEKSKEDSWFIFNEGKMLARVIDNTVKIPRYEEVERFDGFFKDVYYLGRLDGIQCFTAETSEDFSKELGYSFTDLRMLFSVMEEELLQVSSKALELIHWENTNIYCGRCGALNENKKGERSKICPACGLVNYPRISPAVIVAIVKEDKILLAHNSNFKNKMYSVVAGFVEVGETFEDCVKREILEEVGIRVKNINYFGSQPWPFPNSLMVAFTAEHESGEIKVDNVEIDHADWFGRDELPDIPRRGSVARRLIDWFLKKGD